MSVLDTRENDVKNLLHTTDEDKRKVIYSGLGEVIVSNYMEVKKPATMIIAKLDLKKIIYKLNEIAILDTVLMENIFFNIYKFKSEGLNTKKIRNRLMDAYSFYDIIGLNECYGMDLIELINNNFRLFKHSSDIAYIILGSLLGSLDGK